MKKRVLDVIGSSIGLVITSPIIALSMGAVYLQDGKSPFYSQVRVGKSGKKFTMWKIRSMVANADSLDILTRKDDKRITALGKFLRKSNIDELPQLWNVLKGEMSLVGPRPEIPELHTKFCEEIPGYDKKTRVKPGMTGYSQILGFRGDTDFRARSMADQKYVKWRQSNMRDLLIILFTVI